ncbi:MAG: cell division protein FtsQ/DivIB [Acidimicrobiales bacterium]
MSTTVEDPRRAPRPTVDPRVWERRAEVARDERRRRVRRLVVVAVVVAIVVTIGGLLRSSVLDVDRVTVSGADRTGVRAAWRAAGIDRGRAMMSVDPRAAVARLERLPWVARAEVERQWPATVQVQIAERSPIAVAGPASATVLVDRTGRALGPPAAGDTGLPHLSGPPHRAGTRLDPARRRLVAVLAALPGDLRRQVARAAVAPTGSLLILRDAITVRWGDSRRSQAKSDALRAILRQPGRSAIDTIDVTVPSAAAVTGKTGPDR